MASVLYCDAKSDKRVVVAGRLAWPKDLLTPSDGGSPGSKLKYRLTLLLPKDLDIAPLKALEARTAKKAHGDEWQSAVSSRPFYLVEDNEWLAGVADELLPEFIKANQVFSKDYPDMKPSVLNGDWSAYTGDRSDIYSGRWAKVAIEAFAGTNGKNKYVMFKPVIVQLLAHDTRLQLGAEKSMEGFEKVDTQPAADDTWAA